MLALSPRQLAALAFVTLIWGLNWPVMKLGVQDFPPLTFRALSMVLALPVLWLALRAQRVPLAVPRALSRSRYSAAPSRAEKIGMV